MFYVTGFLRYWFVTLQMFYAADCLRCRFCTLQICYVTAFLRQTFFTLQISTSPIFKLYFFTIKILDVRDFLRYRSLTIHLFYVSVCFFFALQVSYVTEFLRPRFFTFQFFCFFTRVFRHRFLRYRCCTLVICCVAVLFFPFFNVKNLTSLVVYVPNFVRYTCLTSTIFTLQMLYATDLLRRCFVLPIF
jgi:hypothetical protein